MKLSSGNKMFFDDSTCENVSSPRDSFYLLNSSTYCCLYPGIFDHNVMHVPNYFELHFALLVSNKVQTNNDAHLEGK
jgi:hypothetical protein